MRGQAFVVYKDVESAKTAIRCLQNFNFYDKPLKLSFSKTKSLAVKNFEAVTGIVAIREPVNEKKENQKANVVEEEDDNMVVDNGDS